VAMPALRARRDRAAAAGIIRRRIGSTERAMRLISRRPCPLIGACRNQGAPLP
jgi:hypothetical protein